MIRFLLLLLILPALPVQAIELFGVDLSVATRDELRIAVKQSGAKLLSEAGKDAFYDVYAGGALLQNAQRFYLGFVKKDQRFAFIEYEFSGLQQPAMLSRLIQKYGQPQKRAGKFISDFNYSWQVDGVQIQFYQDWPNYRTRLSYIRKETLQQLRLEQAQFELEQRKQRLVFNEKAY
jgi:hypothetical protein